MPRINIVLTDDNEEWLRNHIHRKGDMSNIINALLDLARKDVNIQNRAIRESKKEK